MLSFATEFPISASSKTVDFIDAVRRWLLASPHTGFDPEDLANAPLNGPWTVIKQQESFHALIFRTADEEAAAVKHSKTDNDNIVWETTAVFSRSESDAWVSVRTSRESDHFATNLPPAKKPIVVRTLLQNLKGAADGALTVQSFARSLNNNEISLAARLISGEANCYLPVVYISCGFDGRHIIDANSIAHDLMGMAHVVVEPNRPFSQRLQIEVDSQNVYGGAVGIYWPNGQGRRSIFLDRDYDDPKTLKKEIIEEIRAALTNRRPLVRCTWSAVEETSSRLALTALKESGSNEVNLYIEAFDAEQKAKEQLLRDAEAEISRLQAEVRKLEATTSSNSGLVLQTGNERDLYIDEIRQIVRDALCEARKLVTENSRRAHVLDAIIKTIPAFERHVGSTARLLKTHSGHTGVWMQRFGEPWKGLVSRSQRMENTISCFIKTTLGTRTSSQKPEAIIVGD